MKHLNKIAALSLLLAGSLGAQAVNVTFNVNEPDAVSMMLNGKTTILAAGNNTFDMKEYDNPSFTGISPWIISSITDSNGTPQSVYSGTWYKYINSADEGQVYNITVKNLDQARSASCTVNVDDPSMVSATLSGTYSPVTLQQGENTVKFDPESETTLMISSADYTKPLYKVTLNGQDVTAMSGTYNVALTQGCVVDITAKIPAVPVTVTFKYSEEGLGAVSSVAVNDQTVTDFNGTSLSMTAGEKLTIKPNSLYNFTGFMVNGQSEYWTGTYAYSLNVIADTEIYIEAHPYSTINVTVNVTDPEQIILYRGYSYANDRVALSGTSNKIQLPENNTMLSWAVAPGCNLVSVKVDGQAYTSDNFTCKEGTVIDIETKAIVMDMTAAVWIDDRSLANQYFSFTTSTREELGNSFTSGYNVVPFYDAYTPFMLSWYTQNQVVGKVYTNDTLTSPMYEGSQTYTLPLKNLDVVKIFYANEPVDCTVDFEVAEGLDPAVTRDVICPVENLAAALSCFAGTQIDIAKGTQDFDVKVNGTLISPVEDTADYRFTVTEPSTKVQILKKSSVGINGIGADANAAAPVYNLQGVKVADSLNGLPAGIYITAGKKVVVK